MNDNDTAQVTGVTVVAGNARLVVEWTAVGNATGYKVQWKSGSQGYNATDRQATLASGSTTSHTIPSLVNGTEYTVRVTATRTDANDGPPSAEKTGTPAAPTAPGVTVSETALTVTEEDTTGDSYTVVLETQPTADVVVTVAGHAGTEVSPTPTTLTFNATNWNTAQTVTVKAGDDADLVNDPVTLTHSAASTDTDYSGITITEVTVTVNDNDTAQVTGVTVAAGNARLVVEWTAVGNATGYKVQWKSGSQGYNATDRQATLASGSTTSHPIDPGGLTAMQAFLVTTTDHQARRVVEDTLAALGRGHLASARATLGRRVETTGQEESQVTVAGLHVPLGTGVAAAGWAVAERWITGVASGMPLQSGGRTGMDAAPGAEAVGAPGALGAPAARLGMAGGAPFGEGASPTRSNWSPLSAGGQTEFLLALGRGQAGGGAAPGPHWTVWGRHDQQAFGGERSPAARYDGHLRTAYVGFDWRLSERWLAGVAVSRSRGDGDWTFGSSAGRLTTTLTSVHPYLRWSDGGTTIWATAGSGHGSAENERVRYGLQEESALGLRLGLVEVRRRLATVGDGVELQLHGDASWVRLTTAAGDELIDALGVDVHQLRVGIDVSRTVRTAGGTLVEPFGEVHARRDGGSGQTGAGLEVAGELRVARGVFRVEAWAGCWRCTRPRATGSTAAP